MAAGSLTLGGNLSVAVGPLGRNAEGTGALNTKGKMAAMYSYSRTKGLFGGLSVEGSIILERQDANRLAYGGSPTAKQILSGTFDAPPWAAVLSDEIERCTGLPGGRKWRSWDEEGEFGETGAMRPEEWYAQQQAGRKRGASNATMQGTAPGGYAFGEGLGAGGKGSPGLRPYSPDEKVGQGDYGFSGDAQERTHGQINERDREKEQGRKRGSSLGMFDRPMSIGTANPLARLGGSSTPPRPGLSKRTSSFNPFSSSSKDKDGHGPSSPTARRGHSYGHSASSGSGSNAQGMASSENYNAGLTWDSDGPSTPWATRPRAGTGGSSRSGSLRPAHWDRELGLGQGQGQVSGLGERTRSYSDPKLSRTARGRPERGSLLDDEDEDDGLQDAMRSTSKDGGYADTDELGDRVSRMAIGSNANGSNGGSGTRSRSGSGPSYYGHTASVPSGGSGLPPLAATGSGPANRSRANSRLADSYIPDRYDGGDGRAGDGVYGGGSSDPFGNSASASVSSLHGGLVTSTPPTIRSSQNGHSHTSLSLSNHTSTSTSTTPDLGPSSTGYARAVALFDLPASQPGDLALKKGQVVYAMDKVGASGDWWRGMNTHGDAGIFPANYVEVLEIPQGLKGGLSRGELRRRVPELEF